MIRTFAALAALTVLLLAPVALASVPAVLVPPHADSLRAGGAPAPLIIPGRVSSADSLHRTPDQLARQQYGMARELEREGFPAAAIVAYRKAIQLWPQLPDAHYRMGVLFTAVSQHKEAAREYRAELAKHPERRDADRALALELAQLGDTTAAVSRLERLTRSDPADEASWQALGFAYSIAGRPVDGERALRTALALDPKDADAWRDLGVLLAAQKRSDDAREAYARAAKLAPGDAAVWVNLGNLERRVGRVKEALDAYLEGIRRDSSSALAWRGRVALLDALGRPLDAAEAVRAWLARQPDDNSLRAETMERYGALGRKDIGIELARDGVRREPKSSEARLALGMALHDAGNEQAALLEMRHAQSLAPRPDQRSRIGAMIASMRSHAPDSLRGLFAADSSTFERPATAADSSRRRPAR